MICFRCGEKNPDSYRFCGMCGGPLQATKATESSDAVPPSPSPAEVKAVPAVTNRSETFPLSRAERIAKRAATETVTPIGGPSLLGLNEPSLDSLRDKAFSSADETYFEPEVRRPVWMRIFTILVILGGVGSAGWWGYTNYVQPRGAASTSDVKQDAPRASTPVANVPPKKEAAPAAAPTPLPTEPARPAETKTAEPSTNDGSATPKADEQPSPDSAAAAPAKTEDKPRAEPSQKVSEKSAETPAEKTNARKPATSVVARKATTVEEKPVKTAPAVAPPEGEALFRRGEAYLYGRGVAENCDQAIKYLKSASDKSHAKARSAFGTMYATGHCVPRDLPTSYRWFALALRVDPNNQILEKDLSAVWNQMTPPERQLATKSQ